MKNKKKMINNYFPCVKLYLNDIKEIIDILKSESPKSIAFETDDKEFDFSEIKDLGVEKLERFSIKADFSDYCFIYIDFKINSVRIFCSNDKNIYEGICRKIEIFLKGKGRFLGEVAKSWATPFMLGFLLPTQFIFISLAIFREETFHKYYLVELLVIPLSIIFLFLSSLKNVVILKNKNEYESFLKKNWIPISFISTIIIIIIAIVAWRFPVK